MVTLVLRKSTVIKAKGANRTPRMTQPSQPSQPKYETTVAHSLNSRSTYNSHILHLNIVGQQELVSEGPHGCDYAFNDDGTAYRCLRHRWIPGSEASYIEYAYGIDPSFYESERDDLDALEAPTEPSAAVPAPLPADAATFDESDIPF